MPARTSFTALRHLPLLVLLINVAVVGLVRVYTYLNIRPFVPGRSGDGLMSSLPYVIMAVAAVLPALASVLYLWPVLQQSRESRGPETSTSLSPALVARIANIPVALAAFSLLAWGLVIIPVAVHVPQLLSAPTLGAWAHFVLRPVLAGLLAAVTIYFAAEATCRASAWPAVFAMQRLDTIRGAFRVRVAHRHLLLWLAISVLPLGVIAVIAAVQREAVDATRDPAEARLMVVIMFIAASSALGGAWLAWLMSRSMNRPLRALEAAVARLRHGDFDARVSVSATDEIGVLEAGFNQAAGDLRESYDTLDRRNRELADALDRLTFLEHVKRGLDRFVPDTVRKLIEENPEATLTKAPKDVTVLFLDIEGYTRLSELVPRNELTEIVERTFSLFLPDIRREGGDVTETAGDGLMILFSSETAEAHAAAAVRVATAIRAKTAEANRQWVERYPPIAVNVGINSGVCDVGSTQFRAAGGDRWTYTATGPVTNVAARLCDSAKGGQILLSDDTARRVSGQFRLRHVGPLSLKNVSSSVTAWELQASDGEKTR